MAGDYPIADAHQHFWDPRANYHPWLRVGCGYAVMAEAVKLAESAGIDASRLPECLAGGHADSSLLQKLYPRQGARRRRDPEGL